mmetsp:Transcript_72/g.140  ORF Transcript_72/g.140 Transcript_72/m.140 type:complete len:155 (-) Transcript_72:122-586(-)
MQQMEGDDTPAEEWTQQLNAVCNRLSTQYLSLLRTASSVSALGDESRHDPRSGGTAMKSPTDPPPPPLAADVRLGALQCRTAAENLCAAASQLLTLIRTLRLSLLVMDQETLRAEEELQIHESKRRTMAAVQEALQLEQTLMQSRQQSLGGDTK